jgi:hypothetical protein
LEERKDAAGVPEISVRNLPFVSINPLKETFLYSICAYLSRRDISRKANRIFKYFDFTVRIRNQHKK